MQTFAVLIVEDNTIIRDLFAYGVRKYFQRHNFSVSVDFANDGVTALERLKTTRYDLAIVDYYLPVLDGAQLVQRVRKEPSTAGLAIVAISAGGAEARRILLDAGANIYLDKPLTMRDLVTTLDGLTQGA
jgi:CheY-like chemotaxis protein